MAEELSEGVDQHVEEEEEEVVVEYIVPDDTVEVVIANMSP